MTPLQGLAFLTSAINRMAARGRPARRRNRATGGAAASRPRNCVSGVPALARREFLAFGGDDFVENGGHGERLMGKETNQ